MRKKGKGREKLNIEEREVLRSRMLQKVHGGKRYQQLLRHLVQSAENSNTQPRILEIIILRDKGPNFMYH